MAARPQSSVIALDLMRGLAALAVLFSHLRGDAFVEYGALPASQRGIATALIFAATRLGGEAVLVFFVLSGFLVGGQVLARLRDGRFQLYDYAIDRATRIFIPLIPACLFAAVAAIIVFGHPPPIGQLLANMIGLNEIVTESLDTNPVLWSLTYEIWFYVLAGVLACIAVKRIDAITGLLLAICAVVFAILKTRYLVFWILGACISTVRIDVRFRAPLALVGAFAALVGWVLNQLTMDSRSLPIVVHLPSIVAESFIAIGVVMALPYLTDESANAHLARIKGLAAALAAFSYTLYLTHRPTDAMLDLYFGKSELLSIQSFAYYGCRVAICLIVAAGFYFAFERNTGVVRQILRKHKAFLLRTT
jgi:peptidoglycan/LPS O-acetylase OafA/YrhL